MPFGLANAPAVFQRLINRILGPARFEDAITYMDDDILVPSTTLNEGIEKLGHVLEIFKKAGLTLNLEKCLFLTEKNDYLGYEISAVGYTAGTKENHLCCKFP